MQGRMIKMSDKFWILGLLIILAVSVFLMWTLPLMMTVYGETEEECIAYSNEVLMKIQSNLGGGCEWVAGKYVKANWTLFDYTTIPSMSGYAHINGYEVWVLIK